MRTIRPLLAAVVTALTFAAAVLFSAAPASAHDAAESTTPANGATVAVVPAAVSITFSNKPLAIGSGIAVNAGGENWADGAVEIVDNVVTQKLRPGAPAGAFTVVWRVVSSDSHPIEGTFSFTATAAGTTPGIGSASTPPSAVVPTAGTAAPGSTPAPEAAPDTSQPFPWSVVGFAVVAAGLLVFLGVTARRKLAGGSDSDDETGDAGSDAGEEKQPKQGV